MLLAAVGLLYLVRRLNSPLDPLAWESSPGWLTPTAQQNYQPLTRLFSREDLDFLPAQAGFRQGMQRRLRRERRRAFFLYLRQMRRDFQNLWVHCRALAALSSNPDFASLITRQFVVFHSLYFVLWGQCWIGSLVPVSVDVEGLVAALEQLRQGARLAVQSLQPLQAAGAGSR
jgi:hypothetical protein